MIALGVSFALVDWILYLFKGTAAQTVFVSIALAGTLFSVFSIVFGGDGGDVELDSDFDADVEGDLSDGGGGGGDHDGPGLFSLRGLSLFATGFGATGSIVQHYTGKTLVASVSGMGAGVVLAAIGIAFIRLFFQQQASSQITSGQLAGSTGTVTTQIPPQGKGYGQVTLVVRGSQVSKQAMSELPEALPRGSAVRVIRTVGGQVVVEKV